MSAHTPGPWTVTTINGSVRIRADDDRKLIAEVYSSRTLSERQMDARVLAAAPRLLEALQIALVQLGTYRDGDGAAKFHAVNIANDAIAEATGTPPLPLCSVCGGHCISVHAASIIYRKHAGKGDAFNLQRPCDVCGAERGARCRKGV